MSDITRMTSAEFRASQLSGTLTPGKTRTTRKAEPRAGATSHCVRHDETFTTDAAENRHVNANHGCRLEFPDA